MHRGAAFTPTPTVSPSSRSSSRSRSSSCRCSVPRPLFENAIIVSGNTRNRVVAANLATAAMENVRGLAADPTKFTTSSRRDTTVDDPEGERHPVHGDPERAVGRADSTTSSCDSAGVDTDVRSCRSTSRDVAGHGRHQAGAAGDDARAAGRRVLGVDGLDRGEGLDSTGRGRAEHQRAGRGADRRSAADDDARVARSSRSSRPGTYTVTVIEGTGVGDQEVVVAVADRVGVGRPDRVAQFQYDTAATITITGWSGRPATARDRHVDLGREHRPAALRAVLVRRR